MLRRIVSYVMELLSSPVPDAHAVAFAKAWRTAMRRYNPVRYAGEPSHEEAAIANRLLRTRGARVAYRLLRWNVEDGWYEARMDTLAEFEATFDEVDRLRRAKCARNREVA